MKKKAISILLCIYMTATLLVGCGGDEEVAPAAPENTVTEDSTLPEVTPTPEPVIDYASLAPADLLTQVIADYNNQPVRKYTYYYGSNWDTSNLLEQVSIDQNNQLVYLEANNSETGATDVYYLSLEDDTEYVYIADASSNDGYVRITGYNERSYNEYTKPFTVSLESTDEYEISDLTISKTDPYAGKDGQQLIDIVVIYNKIMADAELEVADIFSVSADTYELTRRLTEVVDITNEESAYNEASETVYYTGENATDLGNYLPAYVSELTAITYEEYMG